MANYPASVEALVTGTIPAHNWGPERSISSVNLIVLHTAECPEQTSRAKSIAEWLSTAPEQVSDHFTVSDGETWQQCGPDQVAWHCGQHTTNGRSIGIETTMNSYSKVTPFQLKMFERLAKLVATLCKAYDIPVRWLTPAQVKAGEAGICSHRDVSNGFQNGGHDDDPLLNQGHSWFIDRVNAYAGGASSPAPAPAHTSIVAGTAKVTASTLNVRSNPSTDSSIVTTVPNGTVLTVSAVSNGWAHVSNGWVSCDYLSQVSTAHAPAPAPKPAPSSSAYTVTVTADVLNVRSQPNTTSNVVTTVKKGDVFTIVQTNGSWGKLKSGAGWISLDYTHKN